MKVGGGVTLHAPIYKVWAALNDSNFLVRTVPGCERLEATGADSYKMVVTAGVASIRKTYAGEVTLSDQQAPHSFLMKASDTGDSGAISTEVAMSLADAGDGSTTLSYGADAGVGGVVAGTGQRMLAGAAKKMAGAFISSVEDVSSGRVPAVAAAVVTVAWKPASSGVFAAPDRAPGALGAAGFSEDGFVRGLLVGAVEALVGGPIGGRR